MQASTPGKPLQEITDSQHSKVSEKPMRHNSPTGRTYHKEPLLYETKNGIIKVVSWVRWPSYDFIFGYPAKDHRFYGEEVAFFQLRDTRVKKVKEGFYLDKEELDIIIHGFKRIKKIAGEDL